MQTGWLETDILFWPPKARTPDLCCHAASYPPFPGKRLFRKLKKNETFFTYSKKKSFIDAAFLSPWDQFRLKPFGDFRSSSWNKQKSKFWNLFSQNWKKTCFKEASNFFKLFFLKKKWSIIIFLLLSSVWFKFFSFCSFSFFHLFWFPTSSNQGHGKPIK